jgi:hypothetical protein
MTNSAIHLIVTQQKATIHCILLALPRLVLVSEAPATPTAVGLPSAHIRGYIYAVSKGSGPHAVTWSIRGIVV